MARADPDEPRAGVMARAARILRRPSGAWDEIADEPVSPRELHGRYVAPMAAVPAVCGALGLLVFGLNMADVRVWPSPASTALQSATSYVLTLTGVWALAAIVNVLAPAFGGVRSFARAFKLVAYSGTAAWAAGIFYLYPTLAIPVGILSGLYSLHTLYQGLPKLMRAPAERSLTFFAAILLAVLALGLLRDLVASWAAEAGGPLALG